MNRIYHNYLLWEEYHSGMWRDAEDDFQNYYDIALEIMSDTERFSLAMKKVCDNWKYSCEHNLTNKKQNRCAWLGQAACCIESKIPEYITKSAWWKVDKSLRALANEEAERRIVEWEARHLNLFNS